MESYKNGEICELCWVHLDFVIGRESPGHSDMHAASRLRQEDWLKLVTTRSRVPQHGYFRAFD